VDKATGDWVDGLFPPRPAGMQVAYGVPPHLAAGVQDGELLCDGGPNVMPFVYSDGGSVAAVHRPVAATADTCSPSVMMIIEGLSASPPVTNSWAGGLSDVDGGSGTGAGVDAVPTYDGRGDPLWSSMWAAARSPWLTPGSGGQLMTTPTPNSVGYRFRTGETPSAVGGPTKELPAEGGDWLYWVTPPPPPSVGGGGGASGGGAPDGGAGGGADVGWTCGGSLGELPEYGAVPVSKAPEGDSWRGGGGGGGGPPLPSLPIPPEFELGTLAVSLPQPVGTAVFNIPAHADRLMEANDGASGEDGSDVDGNASEDGSDGGTDDSDDDDVSANTHDTAGSVLSGAAPAAAAAPARPLTRGMAALERANAVEAASNRAAKAAWKVIPANRAAMAAARDAVRRLAALPNGQPVVAHQLKAARLRVRRLNNQKSAAASRASQKAFVTALQHELQQL